MIARREGACRPLKAQQTAPSGDDGARLTSERELIVGRSAPFPNGPCEREFHEKARRAGGLHLSPGTVT